MKFLYGGTFYSSFSFKNNTLLSEEEEYNIEKGDIGFVVERVQNERAICPLFSVYSFKKKNTIVVSSYDIIELE